MINVTTRYDSLGGFLDTNLVMNTAWFLSVKSEPGFSVEITKE